MCAGHRLEKSYIQGGFLAANVFGCVSVVAKNSLNGVSLRDKQRNTIAITCLIFFQGISFFLDLLLFCLLHEMPWVLFDVVALLWHGRWGWGWGHSPICQKSSDDQRTMERRAFLTSWKDALCARHCTTAGSNVAGDDLYKAFLYSRNRAPPYKTCQSKSFPPTISLFYLTLRDGLALILPILL